MSFFRKFFLAVFLLLTGTVLITCTQSDNRPNVVLILADDLGYSDIGAYGGEIDTPNLDRLANEGIKFTQFYNTAKCGPSRASLLTGLYHQQTDKLKRTDNNVTLAEVFGQAGYQTIMAGKWHLGNWKDEQDIPTKRGFDNYFGFLSGAINYFTGENWGNRKNYMRIGTKEYQVPGDFYSTDYFTDYAIEQITHSSENNQPFFLYLAYNAPHFPLQVPPEEIDKYRDRYSMGWDSLRSLRYAKMKQLGLLQPEWELSKRDSVVPPWESLTEEQQKEEQLLMATYAGMVDRMDQQIGRLMGQLEKLKIEDNTIVLFLSDNGGCPFDLNRTPLQSPGPAESERSYDSEWANVSNTPFKKYKQWVHEGGIATPMIVRWPEKIEPGRTIREPGYIIDIMPTLVEAAGLEYLSTFKGHDLLPTEGTSLIPVMMKNSDLNRDPLFWENRGSRAIRDGKWKLVGERGGPWELYNLEKDRTETTNLIEKYPERASEMATKYNEWAKRIGARTNDEAMSMSVNKQDRYLFVKEKMQAANNDSED